MRYIVAYDVSEDHVRSSVAEAIDDYGIRVQWSVFECELDAQELAVLQQKLERLIAGRAGATVRLYPLCGHCAPRTRILGSSGPETGPAPFVII